MAFSGGAWPPLPAPLFKRLQEQAFIISQSLRAGHDFSGPLWPRVSCQAAIKGGVGWCPCQVWGGRDGGGLASELTHWLLVGLPNWQDSETLIPCSEGLSAGQLTTGELASARASEEETMSHDRSHCPFARHSEVTSHHPCSGRRGPPGARLDPSTADQRGDCCRSSEACRG